MPLVLVFGGFTSFETLAKLRRVYRHHLSSVQNLLSDISFYWLVHDGILTMVYYHPYQIDPHFTPCINNTQQAGSTAHCLIWHWHHPMVSPKFAGSAPLRFATFPRSLAIALARTLFPPNFFPGCHHWNLWQFWWFWRVEFSVPKKTSKFQNHAKVYTTLQFLRPPSKTIINNSRSKKSSKHCMFSESVLPGKGILRSTLGRTQ